MDLGVSDTVAALPVSPDGVGAGGGAGALSLVPALKRGAQDENVDTPIKHRLISGGPEEIFNPQMLKYFYDNFFPFQQLHRWLACENSECCLSGTWPREKGSKKRARCDLSLTSLSLSPPLSPPFRPRES